MRFTADEVVTLLAAERILAHFEPVQVWTGRGPDGDSFEERRMFPPARGAAELEGLAQEWTDGWEAATATPGDEAPWRVLLRVADELLRWSERLADEDEKERQTIREGCSLCGSSFAVHGAVAGVQGRACCLDCAIAHGDPVKRRLYEWRRGLGLTTRDDVSS